MGENNKQDIQNGNASSMPDMKSGYPTSGMPYPISGMPYPISGMPYVIKVKQKKMSTGTFAAIAIGIVIAIAAIAVALIILFGNKSDKERKNDANSAGNDFVEDLQVAETSVVLPNQDEYLKYAVTGKVVIDGTEYSLNEGMYNIDNSNMVSIAEFGKMFGFECETDVTKGKVTLNYNGTKYVFTHNNVLCKKYEPDGEESSIGITKKALMFSNGKMYVSVRGLTYIFMFESVENENGSLSIKTNGEITVK